MGNLLSSNGKPSSFDTNGNNVSKLSVLAEQQQQQIANQINDDVLQDVLHFLRRTEHAQVRLASRRLLGRSDAACARYPPRVVPRLEVRGVYAFVDANILSDVGQYFSSSPRYMSRLRIVNSMLVHSPSNDSYLADFPAVEPPEDIVRLSTLGINDFVGPELLQFLRVSTRLLHGGWCMAFNDFDNFVRHHSIDFIIRFFALFPSGSNRIQLRRLSSLTTHLFIDHPTIFGCTSLTVGCLYAFPLDALQGWLHLDQQKPPEEKMDRYLTIWFMDEDLLILTVVSSVRQFVQQLRQRFLSATSCCPFTVEIQLITGKRHFPELREPFVENNERTGEQLVFRWYRHSYKMERRRRESTAAARREKGDKAAKTEERTTMDETMVYIEEVVQGDKHVPDSDSEDSEEGW